MAWTTPRTWVTGELATASLLNTHLRDNLDALRQRNTWTPTDASGAALSFTGVSARYWKTDLLCLAAFEVVYPSTANGSAARIGGLPFTAASAPTNGWAGFTHYSNSGIAFNYSVIGTSLFPYKFDGSQPTNAELSTTSLRGMAIFEATA